MPTYRELLQQVRTEIDEIDAGRARERIEGVDPLVLDVREQSEWDEGHIPGAVHVPRGHLESRIERTAPDPTRPILVYCSAGNRSAFAANRSMLWPSTPAAPWLRATVSKGLVTTCGR